MRPLFLMQRHFLAFFILKMPSNHEAFSRILDPKSAWQPLGVFYHFPSKKHLAAMKRFLPFSIQKTLGGCQTFFRIFHPKNAKRSLGIFYHFLSKKCLMAARCFLGLLIQKNAQQPLGVFQNFQSKNHLVVTWHFLKFSIQKTLSGHKAFFRISHLENVWWLPSILYHFRIGNTWWLLGIFYHFLFRKCLRAAKRFLGFPIQKISNFSHLEKVVW